jgi:hypothetical protein
MMITVIRTATAFPGMTGEAVAWAKEIAAMVKRITGREQVVAMSFAGMLADIAWIGHYDSVGQYDEFRTKVINDHQYIDALKKARQMFVPGSDRDQIWKHE